MKILPILLINLVTVGGALVIYDQVRGESSSTTYDGGGVDPVEFADLASKVERLQDNVGAPVMHTAGDDGMQSRLEAVEKALAVRAPTPGSAATDGPAASGGPTTTASPITIVGEDGPSEQDVRNFRRLQEASNQLIREENERKQLAALLDRLEITMDEKQTDKYISARRDRQKKMGEMFRNLRRGPDVDREQMMQQINEARAKVNDEFAITINKFLPAGDAAKLVESEGQNRWGSGGMRGRGRGGR